MGTPKQRGRNAYTVSVEVAEPKLKRPSLYQVVILNDDFTPMDIVVTILQGFFGMNRERATYVMLQVHYTGKGICGIYTREIAETKVAQVNAFARSQEVPLLCDMEAVLE